MHRKFQLPIFRSCASGTAWRPRASDTAWPHTNSQLLQLLLFILDPAFPTTKKTQARTCVTPPITISIRPIVKSSISHCLPIEITCSLPERHGNRHDMWGINRIRSNAAQFLQLQCQVFDYDIDLTGFEDSKNSESS